MKVSATVFPVVIHHDFTTLEDGFAAALAVRDCDGAFFEKNPDALRYNDLLLLQPKDMAPDILGVFLAVKYAWENCTELALLTSWNEGLLVLRPTQFVEYHRSDAGEFESLVDDFMSTCVTVRGS